MCTQTIPIHCIVFCVLFQDKQFLPRQKRSSYVSVLAVQTCSTCKMHLAFSKPGLKNSLPGINPRALSSQPISCTSEHDCVCSREGAAPTLAAAPKACTQLLKGNLTPPRLGSKCHNSFKFCFQFCFSILFCHYLHFFSLFLIEVDKII